MIKWDYFETEEQIEAKIAEAWKKPPTVDVVMVGMDGIVEDSAPAKEAVSGVRYMYDDDGDLCFNARGCI